MKQEEFNKLENTYYHIIDERNRLETKFKLHFTYIIATFLGIITSLHKPQEEINLEKRFFICICFCLIGLVLVSISLFGELHTTNKFLKEMKRVLDNFRKNKKTVEGIISVPRLKVYNYLLWFGLFCFLISIILFCMISVRL